MSFRLASNVTINQSLFRSQGEIRIEKLPFKALQTLYRHQLAFPVSQVRGAPALLFLVLPGTRCDLGQWLCLRQSLLPRGSDSVLGRFRGSKDSAKRFSTLISRSSHDNLVSLDALFPAFEEISYQEVWSSHSGLLPAISIPGPPSSLLALPSFTVESGAQSNHEPSSQEEWDLNQDCLPPKFFPPCQMESLCGWNKGTGMTGRDMPAQPQVHQRYPLPLPLPESHTQGWRTRN